MVILDLVESGANPLERDFLGRLCREILKLIEVVACVEAREVDLPPAEDAARMPGAMSAVWYTRVSSRAGMLSSCHQCCQYSLSTPFFHLLFFFFFLVLRSLPIRVEAVASGLAPMPKTKQKYAYIR